MEKVLSLRLSNIIKKGSSIIMMSGLARLAPTVSIIVPYYDSKERRDSLYNFGHYCEAILQAVNNIQIILVTNYLDAKDTFNFSVNRVNVIIVNDDENLFSLSKYRNIGVSAAQSEWVILMDIDLSISASSLKEVTSYLKRFPYENSFVIFPTIYMNEGIQNPSQSFDISYFVSEDVQTYAASSSTVALRTRFYLELGGQDETFKGWGFEDWEFANRLIANYDFFPPSKNRNYFNSEGYEHINSYSGLKGMLRLYADYTRVSGFYFYHNWHKQTTSFRQQQYVINNRALFQDASLSYEKQGHQLPIRKKREGDKVLIFQQSPIVYNRQLLVSFNIVGHINSINEYSNIEHSDVKLIISGYVLNQHEFQFFANRDIKVIEPYFWGLSRHVNWLVNRELPSTDLTRETKPDSQDYLPCLAVDSIKSKSLEQQYLTIGLNKRSKPKCLIIFNPKAENDELLLEQRALLFSLAFLHFETYQFFWFEKNTHKNLNDNLIFIDDIVTLQKQVSQADVVIHLNTSLLIQSLKIDKPTVVLNNCLDFFNRLHLNTLDDLDQFMSNPEILDTNLYGRIANSSSEYSLYNIRDKKYDAVYHLESYSYQIRYFNIFVEDCVDKQYSWSEIATVNKKVAAQYFHILKDTDFNRTYNWGKHDNNLEYKLIYNIASEPHEEKLFQRRVVIDWDRLYRRYQKFRKSPKRFFEDSRFHVLNILGKFYK